MTTLTLDQLAADTARLKAQFGGHYPTSILELQAQPRVISAVASEVELLTELVADAEKHQNDLADEITILQKESKAQDEQIDQLKALLSEKEEGKTIIEWKLEADEAKAAAEASRRNAMEWHEELLALRNKKGVSAGLFKRGDEIVQFLEGILNSPGLAVAPQTVTALLSKIRNTK